MKWRDPIAGLLVLVALAFVGWLLIYVPAQILSQYKALENAHPAWIAVYFSILGLGAALLVGATVWVVVSLWSATARKRHNQRRRGKNPSELTPEQQEQEVRDNLAALAELRSAPDVDPQTRGALEPLVDRFEQKRQRQTLEIVAFGSISSGKSSLLNLLAGSDVFATDVKGGVTTQRNEIPWPGHQRVTLVDTPGLGEIDGEARAAASVEAARDADLVLFVVDGPLRQWEFQLLQQLVAMEKRALLCLNKADWYSDAERDALRRQLAEQTAGLKPPVELVVARSRPGQRLRARVTSGGEEVEETVETPPDISDLAERMLAIVRRDGSDLLLANLLLRSRGLVDDARRRVRAALDERAWSVVHKYAWGAGGAVALNPVPLVDLLIGPAVLAKMVVDLAAVYRQSVDLAAAGELLGQVGKNLLATLGAQAAAPAAAAVVASLLKTAPGVGTIAGGLLQGLVQALVTRWVGAVFIDYFGRETQPARAALVEIARDHWQKLTTAAELRKLIQQARAAWQRDA